MFKLRRKRTNVSLILMYHRINTVVTDTWQLSVSPENFAGQMEALASYHVIPLEQMVKDRHRNSGLQNSIALSFDDGYLDNFIHAKPLLEKHQYPATFFLTNLAADTYQEFWWDFLEFLLLENEDLPPSLTITIGQQSLHWNLDGDWSDIISEQEMKIFSSWLPWKIPPSTPHALFIYLSEWMKGLPFADQQSVLRQLRDQCGKDAPVRAQYRKMDEQQIILLCQPDQFEIGGHSAYHTALGKFTQPVQSEAVGRNKDYLTALTGRSPKAYAYAHGSYNEKSISILQEYGYQYACTTTEGTVSAGSNALALPRYQVKNWNRTEFGNKLNEWLNG